MLEDTNSLDMPQLMSQYLKKKPKKKHKTNNDNNRENALCDILQKSPLLNIYIFIAISLDETSNIIVVHVSMKIIYQSCDLVHAVGQNTVDVSQ